MFNYKPYIKSLTNYMVKNDYTSKPLPSIELNDKKQDKKVFIQTGYYDPENKKVVLFTNERHPKDVLRSCAHELIHHKQNIDGVIANNGYKGTTIVDDDELIKLEEEAYLKGNIAFRKWTETVKK